MAWTADDLLTSLRLRCRIPDGASVASDTELLTIADDQIATVFSPLMRQVQQEYGIQATDLAVSASTNEYPIPARATAANLRDVVLMDDATGTSGVSIPRVSLEEADRYEVGGNPHWAGGAAFALRGDRIILLPSNVSTSRALRLYWYLRPSQLVLTTNSTYCHPITTAGTATVFVCATTQPDDNSLVDVVTGERPTTDLYTVSDVASVAGSTVTLGTGCWYPPTVGDYVCVAGYTPIVPLPPELHPILVTACSVNVWEMLGDHRSMEIAAKRLGSELAQARILLSPRVDGEEPRIINRASALRGAGRRRN